MDNNAKQQIATDLSKFVAKFDSQNKAVNQLKNVSVATVSNILSGKNLEKVSDEMWWNIANQIKQNESWQIVPTNNYKLLSGIFKDAAMYSNVFGVIGDASAGKTQTAERYIKEHVNAYLVKCDEFWNRRTFLVEILHAMNIPAEGHNVPEMMLQIVKHMLRTHKPVLILDEIDKVSDNILCSVISIYNRLEGNCGIVVMATSHLERRMERGLRLNKKGFSELHSRLGKKLIELDKTTREDIEAIVIANGINNPELVASIYNDCENDLRRVKRLVHKYKRKGGK